MFSTIVSVSPF